MVAPSKPCSAKTSPAALRILSRVLSSLTSGAAPRFSRTIMLKHLNHCLKQSSETFVLHDCLHFAHALGNFLPAALRPCRGLLAAFFFAPRRKVRTHFGNMVDSHTRFFGTSKFLSRSDCGGFSALQTYHRCPRVR